MPPTVGTPDAHASDVSAPLWTRQAPAGDAVWCHSCRSEVGTRGFEPPTTRPPAECATRLRHVPIRGQSTRPRASAPLACVTYAAGMDEADFDQVVEDALDGLPDWAADALDNVVVIVEDHDPDDPDLLGVYVGIPLTERGHEPPLGPSRIIVYRRPLTEMSDSIEELREEIRITVLHEIGHHFGIDEDRLDELGYA
jgi:predicted Zn-dependent protease with MMP-like domain